MNDLPQHPDLSTPAWQNEQRRVYTTPDYKHADLFASPDTLLASIARDIEGHVNALVAEGATRVTIKWYNTPERIWNPLRDHGYFRIVGVRPKPTTIEGPATTKVLAPLPVGCIPDVHTAGGKA